MDKPKNQEPDLFGEEALKAHVRLTRAWLSGGKEAIKQELMKMYPEEAARTSQELPRPPK
jgi:hypothetical protein